MKTTLEIEFKTAIDENTYNHLLEKFQLKDKTFVQINHYFDTDNEDIIKKKFILRIRQKGNRYKLTSKEHTENGTIERHIELTQPEALKMLENGFNAKIIGLNYDVKKVAELKTTRTKVEYKNGILFFDKNNYYDKEDFEIEYEATSIDEGKITFDKFLKEYNIPYIPMISKTKRAYKNKNQD